MFGAALDSIRSALAPALPWGRRVAAVVPQAAFGLLLLAILAYAGYFAYYTLSGLDLVGLLRDVNVDDSFYYFQIARNLAEGQFSTVDEGITRTNGYHPAWMLLITPFYWVLDLETALFGIKAFELGLIGGSVALLAAAARLCRLPWVALFAVPPLLYPQEALWFGLEAACGLFALSLLFLALSLLARQPGRWWPLLAAVAFLLPWVRLEYLAISLTATAGAAIVVWMQGDPAVGAALRLQLGRFRIRLPAWRVYAPFLAAGLGGMIYFVYNQLVFGGYVPVSGAVKEAWSQQWFERAGGFDLTANARMHWQYGLFQDGLLVAAEIVAYAALAALVWWVGRRASKSLPPLFLVGAAALAIGLAAMFVHRALTIHPFYNVAWHFVPTYLLLALIIPIRCFTAVYLLKVLVSPRWPKIGRLLTGATVGATVIALVATVDFTQAFKTVDHFQSRTFNEWHISMYLGTQVMNRILPDDAVVGALDSGVIGYFADFPVVNLDGLVNDYDYYSQYIRSGQDSSTKVHQKYGITYYAYVVTADLEYPNARFQGAKFDTGVPQQSQEGGSDDADGIDFTADWSYYTDTVAFTIWPPDDYAAVNDGAEEQLRALLQEYADYYSDGAAALVSANLVQTFSFDCPPTRPGAWLVTANESSEEAENGSGDKLVYFWGDLRRNNLGYCTESFELPNDTAHPVEVTMQPFTPAVNELLAVNAPLVQSDWAVYRIGRQLLYQRAPCTAADTAATFYLNLIPAAANDLPRWQREYGYTSRDFEFDAAGGVRHAGRCVVTALLPDYAIAGIRTGQYRPETGSLWSGDFYTETYRAARADELAAQAGGEPVMPGFYNVYYDDGTLTYVREDCVAGDTAAAFYLHLVPSDAAVLPAGQREHGFDNRDFEFGAAGGVRYAGRCLVSVELPDYAIDRIRTGQYTPGAGRLWAAEFAVGAP